MENLRFGLEVMLMGFTGVFIALFILFLLLVMLDRFFSRKNNAFTGASGSGKGSPGINLSAPVAVPAVSGDERIDDELMAAVSAAVFACMQKPVSGFSIKHIKPVPSTNSWVYYGRTRLMEKRGTSRSKRREKDD